VAEFETEVAMIVGGRGLIPEIRRQMRYAAYCDNLNHLEAFLQSLRGTEETQNKATE